MNKMCTTCGASNPAAVVDAEKESWTCTPEGDLKFLLWKKIASPIAK